MKARAFADYIKLSQVPNETGLLNVLFSEFPTDNIKTCASISDIINAINEIFMYLEPHRHMNWSIPFKPLKTLIHMLANDIAIKLKEILGKNIMNVNYILFVNKTKDIEIVFHKFNNGYFKRVQRAGVRRRPGILHSLKNYCEINTETELSKLKIRIESIKKIRELYNEFKKVIYTTFEITNKALLNKIDCVFNGFRKLDVLNIKIYKWHNVIKEYDDKIEEIENEIGELITKDMKNVKDANEMFVVCDKYKRLFVRNRILYKILEFQDDIFRYSKQKINKVQLQFEKGYKEDVIINENMPNVCCEFLWFGQLNDELDSIANVLKLIFGDNYLLINDINILKKKADPMIVVKRWENKAGQLSSFNNMLPIFRVYIDESDENNNLCLDVEFDEKYVELMKSVDGLLSFKIRVDIALRLNCIDIKTKYPIATKLKNIIAMFNETCIGIDMSNMKELLSILIDEYKYNCQQIILKGTKYIWMEDNKQLNKYIETLNESVMILHNKFKIAYELLDEIDKILNELIVCQMNEIITNKM
eukprot:255509_1